MYFLPTNLGVGSGDVWSLRHAERQSHVTNVWIFISRRDAANVVRQVEQRRIL